MNNAQTTATIDTIERTIGTFLRTDAEFGRELSKAVRLAIALGAATLFAQAVEREWHHAAEARVIPLEFGMGEARDEFGYAVTLTGHFQAVDGILGTVTLGTLRRRALREAGARSK